jgi:predicted MFS family arabinose efflux permease
VIEPTENEILLETALGTPGAESATGAESGGKSLELDLALSKNRDFKVFVGGQGLSSIGDSITFTALPLLVLALTGSGLAMGVVGILQAVPDLLLGLFAGALADRLDRRRMMLGADIGRALLTALIPLTAAVHGPAMAVILLVTFPINCLRVLWLAGYTAAVPGLVGRSQIGRANSITEAVFNGGFILGPAIAGLLATVIGPGPTIAFDAASFAISATALVFIRRPLRPSPRPEATHILADIRDGIRFVVGHPVLRNIILFWGLVAVGTGALIQALTYDIEVDRGLGAAVLGFVVSAFGVGSLVGAIAASRLVGGVLGRNMLLGTLATGVTLFVIALKPPVPLVIASAFFAGVAQSNVLIAYLTLRTTHSPDALLGRVGSTARLVSIGLTPIGLLGGGLLIDAAGGATALAAMGVWMVALTVVFAAPAGVRGARAPAVRPSA